MYSLIRGRYESIIKLIGFYNLCRRPSLAYWSPRQHKPTLWATAYIISVVYHVVPSGFGPNVARWVLQCFVLFGDYPHRVKMYIDRKHLLLMPLWEFLQRGRIKTLVYIPLASGVFGIRPKQVNQVKCVFVVQCSGPVDNDNARRWPVRRWGWCPAY